MTEHEDVDGAGEVGYEAPGDETHVDESDLEIIHTNGPAFARAVVDDPEVVGVVDEVIVRALDGGSDLAMRKIAFGLGEVIGPDASTFLAYYLTHPEPAHVREHIAETLAPVAGDVPVLRELRRLQALYGQDVSKAFRLAEHNSQTWSNTHREVFYDSIADVWVLEQRIDKLNGESITLHMTVDDLQRLIAQLLRTLQYVGEPRAFGQAAFEHLVSELATLLGKFGIELTAATVDEEPEQYLG